MTKGKRIHEYLDLCGSIFVFPGAELNDRFWDDDYREEQSFKSWLRSKYVHGYYDYSVENSFLRNIEHVRRFKDEYKDMQELIDLRTNILNIESEIRFGNAARVRKFIDSEGEVVSGDLIEKLQKVVLDMEPVCVMADGLNMMDDVGGLHGFYEFLRKLNSKEPEDLVEKENLRQWASGMGWTGRKSKAENML